ncbi:hypothetical protein HDU96_010882, partial [Phlyctochytrium bullatum]
VAGRVVIRNGGAGFSHRLVRVDRAVLRIPTLAIHLDRGVNSEGFKFNTETHLTPMLATAAKILNSEGKKEDDKHHPAFLKLLADSMNVQPQEIGDFELCLYDTQPSIIGGLENEFIFSPRIDNLMSSYCAITALVNSVEDSGFNSDSIIRVVALFDNEEVGSVSAYGAGSNLLESTLRRLADAEVIDDDSGVSTGPADMAHAVHPNYSEKHEDNHRPSMNKGVVIKQNANQRFELGLNSLTDHRYATTAITTAMLREIARIKDVPLQEFLEFE